MPRHRPLHSHPPCPRSPPTTPPSTPGANGAPAGAPSPPSPAPLTPPQTLLPPGRPAPPPRAHVRLWRQGASPSRTPRPRLFTAPCPRIVAHLRPLPSPRWSSAEKTTRWSVSSASLSSPDSPHALLTHSAQRTRLFLFPGHRRSMVS